MVQDPTTEQLPQHLEIEINNEGAGFIWMDPTTENITGEILFNGSVHPLTDIVVAGTTGYVANVEGTSLNLIVLSRVKINGATLLNIVSKDEEGVLLQNDLKRYSRIIETLYEIVNPLKPLDSIESLTSITKLILDIFPSSISARASKVLDSLESSATIQLLTQSIDGGLLNQGEIDILKNSLHNRLSIPVPERIIIIKGEDLQTIINNLELPNPIQIESMAVIPINVEDETYLITLHSKKPNEFDNTDVFLEHIQNLAEIALVNKLTAEQKIAKAELMKTIDHDLNTLTTLIKTRMYILRRTLSNAEVTEDVREKLENSIANLEDRINLTIEGYNDALKFSTFYDNKYTPEYNETKVPDLLKRIVGAFNASKVNIEELDPNLDMAVYTDRFLLSIVLQNLIGNAIKYSSDVNDKPVKANVYKTAEGLILEITDSGPGFATEQIKYLEGISDSYTIDPNTTSKLYGLGLGYGLGIIKRAVGYLKGQIKVETIKTDNGEEESETIGSKVIIKIPIIDESKEL